jgi:hypothetical protein
MPPIGVLPMAQDCQSCARKKLLRFLWLEMASQQIVNTAHMDDNGNSRAQHSRESRSAGKPGRSGPPGNKNAVKHGYYFLVKMIKGRGGASDRRTDTLQDGCGNCSTP